MMDVLKSKLVIAKSLLESKTNFLNYKKKKKLLTFSLFTLFSVNFLKSNDYVKAEDLVKQTTFFIFHFQFQN